MLTSKPMLSLYSLLLTCKCYWIVNRCLSLVGTRLVGSVPIRRFRSTPVFSSPIGSTCTNSLHGSGFVLKHFTDNQSAIWSHANSNLGGRFHLFWDRIGDRRWGGDSFRTNFKVVVLLAVTRCCRCLSRYHKWVAVMFSPLSMSCLSSCNKQSFSAHWPSCSSFAIPVVCIVFGQKN